MLDSTTPLQSIPDKETRVALYYNGHLGDLHGVVPAGKAWLRVYWIDVLGTNPRECSILDIEKGDTGPETVLSWVPARLDEHEGELCRLYCNLSTWPAVRGYVGKLSLPHRNQVRYWIADPTMKKHVVPGSAGTQWYWGNMDPSHPVNFDRSEVIPAWDK